MSCKDLKVPTPPSIENLPPGIKAPSGMSLDSIKGQAAGGLSGSLNGAQDMISGGLKKLGSSLSPTALAGKVGEAIDGVAGQISSTVKGALDGVTSLKNKISSLGSGGFKVPGVGDVKGQVTAKLGGAAEFSSIRGGVDASKCTQKFAGQAAAANKGVKDKANNFMANLSPKERAEAMRDPAKRAELQAAAEKQVSEETKADAIKTATTADKSTKTSQDDLQAYSLNTVDANAWSPHKSIFNWLRTMGLNQMYHSYYWYQLQVYYRSEQFKDFGFWGIKNSDADNALDTIRTIAEEVLTKQMIIALLEWFQQEFDRYFETGILDEKIYPDFKNITELSFKTITDVQTGKTFRETLADVSGMYFDSDNRSFDFFDMNTLDATVPMVCSSMAAAFNEIFWTEDRTFTNLKDPHNYRSTTGFDIRPAEPAPGLISDLNNMWIARYDDYKANNAPPEIANFQQVLDKKKDRIAKTIQDEKEDAYNMVYDQRSSLSLTMQSLPNSIKKTYDDPTRYIFYARPKFITDWASQLVQVRWDPATGAVKSVHKIGLPSTTEKNLASEGIRVWKKNSFFENTLN